MCMYSLHARSVDMRKAKVGETLTMSEYRGHACFTGADGKLACLRHETTLSFERIEFDRGTAPWVIEKYAGKAMTATLIEGNRHGRGRHYAADCIRLSTTDETDTVLMHLSQIKQGITARIPRKVRKDAGTKRPRNLTKVLGLDQIKADIPKDVVKV